MAGVRRADSFTDVVYTRPMTNPLARAIAVHSDLPEDAQKAAGKAITGSMGQSHTDFLNLLLDLLNKKEIDPGNPKSFLNTKIYDALKQEEKDQIDLALLNLGHQLEDIIEFRLSTQTPDSSPQLQTMIEQLWDIKQRIEDKAGDVFKF